MADKPQILIVEDDLDLSDMLSVYFSNQGYQVTTAAWGQDAVNSSQISPPDLVILDVRLPDFDGYEVCRRIRTNRRTQDTPIIFLTERRDRVDKLTGLELGVVDYITKPFDIQELRLRVRNSLRRAEQHALINPVTNLPEDRLTDDKLRELIQGTARWSLLYVSILGLDAFRDRYGFVASDDVLRGVALMLNNAIRELGTTSDTIGHLAPNAFVIATDTEHLAAIRERAEGRVRRSMSMFQPTREQDDAATVESPLQLMVGQLNSTDGDYESPDAVKAALMATATIRQ